MAPEQLEGRRRTRGRDIFAFGAVVYEMVTGKKAFEGKSQASLIGGDHERRAAAALDAAAAQPPALDPSDPDVSGEGSRRALAVGEGYLA